MPRRSCQGAVRLLRGSVKVSERQMSLVARDCEIQNTMLVVKTVLKQKRAVRNAQAPGPFPFQVAAVPDTTDPRCARESDTELNTEKFWRRQSRLAAMEKRGWSPREGKTWLGGGDDRACEEGKEDLESVGS